MPYLLGAVKPHVKMAADTLGPKYGFSVIYGWRAIGSVPNSDHPKGLALDFMTFDKAKGDALVADLIANSSAYAVKYIVWYRRSWNPKRGSWAPYTSTGNPHTDHVHVSFEAVAGSGNPSTVTPGVTVGLPGQSELQSLLGIAKDVNAIVSWFTRAENWRRIGIGAAGFVLVLLGVVALLGKNARDTTPVVQIVKSARRVIK